MAYNSFPMAIPEAAPDKLVAAFEKFDNDYRQTAEWVDWEKNGTYRYAIEHDGKLYPVKKIVSLATDVSVRTFSGGNEANNYVKSRGFTVIELTKSGTVLKTAFQDILTNFERVRNGPFRKDEQIWSAFRSINRHLQGSEIVRQYPDLKVTWSVGQGNWTTTPWIALLDGRETKSTESGIYCVYIFRADLSGFYLIYGQGVTEIRDQFRGSDVRTVLANRAAALRKGCFHLSDNAFTLAGEVDLRGDTNRSRDYQASTIAYKYYDATSVPEDEVLLDDLETLLDTYEEYVDIAAKSSPRTVKIAPGENARYWQDCKTGSYICVGWDKIGDLTAFPDKQAFRNAFKEEYLDSYNGNQSTVSRKANELWTLRELAPGDIVVANRGMSEILAVGRVLPPVYEWSAERTEFKHLVNVLWDLSFAKRIPSQSTWQYVTTADIPSDLAAIILGTTSSDPIHQVVAWIDQIRTQADPTDRFHYKALVLTALLDLLDSVPEHANSFSYQELESWVINQLGSGYKPTDFCQPYMRLMNDTNPLQVWLPQGNFEQYTDQKAESAEWVRTNFPQVQIDDSVWPSFQSVDGREAIRREIEKRWPSKLLSSAPKPAQPKYSVQQFSDETGFSAETINGWYRTLQRKKHVVFQGPPGTGKTFIAQRLAKLLTTETTGIMDKVQFHPAYAYEDFMQGIRPVLVGGSIAFELRDGRFLDFCKRAQEEQPAPCVLIIDEINRANLSRVFGELMYLLEYRDEAIPLAAGGQPFQIPQNVHLIGTMNTADRSIALVDHALRRRFSFIRLDPNFEVLKGYLDKQGLPSESLVTILREVNGTIEDPNYAIGISFFLRGDLKLFLADIWTSEIEPYLEEFFYDQREKVHQFRWAVLVKDRLKDWA
jgi:hypothetical protein